MSQFPNPGSLRILVLMAIQWMKLSISNAFLALNPLPDL
jgi:hypothetical protein